MGKLDGSRTDSTRDDYETPQHVLDRVREVFGGQIDLDPFANKRNSVGAQYYQTAGGFEAWDTFIMPRTRVFCNPPYGGMLLPFAQRVTAQARVGTYEIITLTPARSDTKWYDLLSTRAACYAEIRGRIVFDLDGKPVVGKNGKPQPCQFPCAMHYFGSNPGLFSEVMRNEGFARIAKVIG